MQPEMVSDRHPQRTLSRQIFYNSDTWCVFFRPCVCLFVALRPKSTAMVIAGRSVHLTTLFPGQA